MKKQLGDVGLKVGDLVKIVAGSLPWREIHLRDEIGELIELREDGKITVLFNNGRLLVGRDHEAFERTNGSGLKVKGK
jgi:hypothetical protein